jgi:glycerol-3-phosphate dehydrogenase
LSSILLALGWIKCVNGEQENGTQIPIGKTRKIGGTKGSHIIVDPFPGAPETTLYVEAKSDGRPFFIVPWLGMYLIGTTDLRYQGNLDRVKADDDEIDYLLTETNGIIPSAQLSRKDLKFTYSGVRPLPYAEGKKAGSITRRHILHDHSSEGVKNMISLIGGKLTTYRHVAEEMVDAAYKKLGKSAPKCPTLNKPLPGCILPNDPRVQQAVTEYQEIISLSTINYLFSIYGSRTVEILELAQQHPELAETICEATPDIKAQILYAVKTEFAQTFVDIARRRTVLAMRGNYGLDLLSIFSDVLQKYGNWSREDCDRAVEDYHSYMKENCIPDFDLQ